MLGLRCRCRDKPFEPDPDYTGGGTGLAVYQHTRPFDIFGGKRA
jgi:hypothetical protein